MREFEINKSDLDTVDYFSNNTLVDSAFRKIQKNHTGFFIWRIEGMNAISLPLEHYGTFFSTDSYVIYACAPSNGHAGIDTVPREIKSNLEEHIHFWLGADTTSEKSGVAGYKTVELDKFLGGTSVQHRETQANESARFKSYFKNGIRYLKSDNSCLVKLYKVIGSNVGVLMELVPIAWDCFNSTNVFILQTADVCFVWLGRVAKSIERLHAAKEAQKIKEDAGSEIVFIDDGYERTINESLKVVFEQHLPLKNRLVLPKPPEDEAAEVMVHNKKALRLYKCSEINGKYRVTEIKLGPLVQSDLDSNEVFIIDGTLAGIWIWAGKRVPEKERSEAMRNARGFVKKKKYPNNITVSRVIEGSECAEFRSLFCNWKCGEEKARRVLAQFDALSLQEQPTLAAQVQLVDDGTGSVKTWTVRKNQMVQVPKEKNGHFVSSDCYIIWYNYAADGERNILFCWFGLNHKKEDATLIEQNITELDEQLNGTSTLYHIHQGHEPPQFLQVFKGKLRIYQSAGPPEIKAPSTCLLRIEGSSTCTAKATQVQCDAASLSSGCCFVLKKGKHYYVWCGSNSTGDQKEMAKHFAGKDFQILLEGKEADEFWKLLGGKRSIVAGAKEDNGMLQGQARMFYCYEGCGVDEIFNFQQHHLIPEELILIDINTILFIWIGQFCNGSKKRNALKFGKEYLLQDLTGRDKNVTVALIKQGHEPPNFIGLFKNWDDNYFKEYKRFDELRLNLSASSQLILPTTRQEHKSYDHSFDDHVKYPVPILKQPSDKLPQNIDPMSKELHLTHDDFVSVFRMGYSEFQGLPKWKQQEIKKNVGLF